MNREISDIKLFEAPESVRRMIASVDGLEPTIHTERARMTVIHRFSTTSAKIPSPTCYDGKAASPVCPLSTKFAAITKFL